MDKKALILSEAHRYGCITPVCQYDDNWDTLDIFSENEIYFILWRGSDGYHLNIVLFNGKYNPGQYQHEIMKNGIHVYGETTDFKKNPYPQLFSQSDSDGEKLSELNKKFQSNRKWDYIKRGPWVDVIENFFKKLEKEIKNHKLIFAAQEQEKLAAEEDRKSNTLEYFKKKFK